MSKLKEADFYYGAVLSTLLNHNICPALIEGGNDRQVYDFTTDNTDFRLFVKYRSNPVGTKAHDYSSWNFSLSNSDIKEISDYLNLKLVLSVGFICGEQPLHKSQYAVLHADDIRRIVASGKTSITLGIKKGEKAFRLFIDGKKENAILIPTNRLY